MTDEPLEVLAQALDAARKAGADAADAVLIEGQSLAIGWRLGALEELERKDGRELGLRVLVGRRVATVTTSRLEPAEIAQRAEDAVASARLLPEDPYAGLADPASLATGWPDLDLDDPGEPTPEALMRAAAAAEDAARAVAGVTNSDGAGASWGRRRFALATSNGFTGTFTRSRHSLGATVLAGSGTGMERDYEYRDATHAADLPDPAAIGRTAGERTVRRLGPRKVTTAKVPVLYEPRAATSLVRHLTSAISGDAVAAGRSFLKDSLGQSVFAAGICLVEDPRRRRGAASRPFDGEGVATAARTLVDDGVLTTWLLDSATGRRLGLPSTGHASRGGAELGGPSATNLRLEPGAKSPEALMAEIGTGLLVTDLLGIGVSTVTGDYSRGAAGFWIENGELAYPVGELTIAANLRDIFKSLAAASDVERRGSVELPTVLVEGLTVAGR